MTPARWAQIKELFLAASEKPPEQREAFMNEICPDASIRQEIRKLLKAEGGPDLESPVPEILRVQSLPPAIGRYRIIRLLGEGGMGVVYEAEQDQPRRTVALKVMKAGLASTEMMRRFEHELQLLGRLKHPGIAQIYEGGTADTGFGLQPYFAMEFIQGPSLLQYASEHQLSARERLEIIVKVCEAVYHAHQRGIIHRDLKPGNILVDETAQPKVLDFGVARATDSDAQPTQQTNLGQLVGTLAYMSPEQVLADPLELDTRSDVYALGVILFELLAGRQPYTINGPLPKVLQTIREETPPRLSSFSRAYRGDIETIVAKALEKEKTRRYASAAELAADIQRYLRNEPVAARRSTVAYHLWKFARRHSALMAGIAAFFVILITGVIVSTAEATRARRAEQEALRERDWAAAAQQSAQRERDRAVNAERSAMAERNRAIAERQRADTESATANAIKEFLQHDLLAQASTSTQARPGTRPDPDLKVRTALDRAAARIGGRFDQQPLVEAAIRETIGDTYRDLGLYPEAQGHAERALDLERRALGEGHPDTLSTMDHLAVLYRHQGKYAQAEPLYIKVLEQRRRILGPKHPATLTSMNNLAQLYLDEHKYAEAEILSRQVVDLARRIKGAEHPDTLTDIFNLGNIYRSEGKYAKAEPLLIHALDAERRVLGEEHPNTLGAMNTLAVLYHQQGRYAEAEPLYQKALELRRRVRGDDHPDTLVTASNLASLYRSEGNYAKAEPLLLEALSAQRRVLGETHPYTLNTLNNLAVLFQLEGKRAEAESLFLNLLEIRRRDLGPEHPETLASMRRLGRLYLQERNYAAAEPLLTEAAASGRRALRKDDSIRSDNLTALAELRLAQQKYTQAESLLREVMSVQDQKNGRTWEPFQVQSLLGRSLMGQSKFAQAEPLLIAGYQGLCEREAAIPESRSILDEAGAGIVLLYRNSGKADEAASWQQQMEAHGCRAATLECRACLASGRTGLIPK